MILGGSYGQLEAIKTAKRLGLTTLVVDMNPNAIGFRYADYYEVVSTTDFLGVEKVARDYGISGILTISSDIAVPVVCYVNEQLGLPNQGWGIAKAVTDKTVMRELFKKSGVSSPEYYIVTREDSPLEIEDKVKPILEKHPLIVKPSDSSGSRGVQKITCMSELMAAIEYAQKFSRNKMVIIEEFIQGLEIGAQSLSIAGEMELCFIHNDKLSENMIPIGHSLPASLNEKQIIKIKKECQKALASLGITHGPSNIDIIIDHLGTPYIIEIGARIGATKLPEIVKYNSGIDLIELAIRMAIGEKINLPTAKNKPVAVEMLYFNTCSEIQYNSKKMKEAIEPYNPLEYHISLPENNFVHPLNSGVDVYGHVICTGETSLEAEENCAELMGIIKSGLTYLK
ncbi:D-ala D-ala ligase C-terminus [Sediminibacillus albus]|uniref:D-ala D-ala ligase C-terminus n=2 Tax=Sediminibacillus albus TaxID=407036 RepID=A0A1G8YPQ9_9BACI|nr:D-ala D-ala ligase C-terminus [Sediminibacillus albus]